MTWNFFYRFNYTWQQYSKYRGIAPKLPKNISNSSMKLKWFYFNTFYQILWTNVDVGCWQKGWPHILSDCLFPPSSAVAELVFVGWVRSPSSCTNLMPTLKSKENIQLGVAGHTYVRLQWLVSPQAKKMCRILLSACKQKPQTIEELSWEHCVTFQVSMLATKGFEMWPSVFE